MQTRSKKPVLEHFTEFDKVMRALVGARDCGCELAGIEPALDLARQAVMRAAPELSRLDGGEDVTPLARAHIELAYYALVIVVTIVHKDGVISMVAGDAYEDAVDAIGAMIGAIRPYLAHREEQFQRAVFTAECMFEVPDHKDGPEFSITAVKPSRRGRGWNAVRG